MQLELKITYDKVCVTEDGVTLTVSHEEGTLLAHVQVVLSYEESQLNNLAWS